MRDALIVGAGIGGLAAGLALRRAGWTVRVLERASSRRELGFALLLAPNATYALRQLGVADAVLSGGGIATRGEMCRADGTPLKRFDLERVRELLPDPTATVLRPVLHGALLDALGADALLLGSEVTGFETDASGVVVVLADGRRMHASVVIGADGIGSVIRRQLHPDEPPPRRSGLFGLRGVAHEVAHHLQDSSGAQYFGRGVEAGLGHAGGGTVYWYLSVLASAVARYGPEPRRLLEQCAGTFHERFRAIAFATAPGDMRLDECVDRPPLVGWGRGPITLLGDAAHPMLPHAGQGAAQALEDAVALGRVLGRSSDPEAGLREYERTRAPRTAAVVRLSRRNARLSALDGAVTCWMRDALIRLIPERLVLKQLVALGRPPDA